jgi:urease alpha subunit
VLWRPQLFGAKPEMVLKGGFIAWAQMGDPNASIPTPQPLVMRPMFGAFGRARAATSLAFVSRASIDRGIEDHYKLTKRLHAVKRCRKLSKLDMKFNHTLPRIEVDPETYTVTADGIILKCDPAKTLPLAQRYFLF